MKKIETEKYAEYQYIGPGYSVTMRSAKEMAKLFDSSLHGTLYGIKHNGERAIIDQK